ncbi:hypothetical protein [Paraburkholderia sediminicola]|uniref:hypothetical protein n=1 Tax=Paraburkholderia sediminicola TaxID=458836 RepID=UPI0038BA06DF
MAYPSPQFTTPAIGDNSQNAATTAFVDSALGYLNGRNYIVDGNFDNWIGTSTSITSGANSTQAATMYTAISGTGGAATINRQPFVGNDPIGMTSPARYYYQHSQTTAGTGSPAIDQHIESVQTLQGRSATFSCWIWCPSGTVGSPIVQFAQYFGSGGSPSATVSNQKVTTWNITTTPQRFSIRLDFPSIGGKTTGTAGNDYVDFALIFPNGVFTINTSQWQLEQCSPSAPATGAPTAFDYRGVGPELARVQRYYQTQGFYQTLYGVSGNSMQNSVPLQPMRAIPACAFAGAPGTSNVTSYSVAGLTQASANLVIAPTANALYAITGSFTADARL